jgi:cytoskeletal protein CcmA (bactofilin family)
MFGKNKPAETSRPGANLPGAVSHALNSLVAGTKVEGSVQSANDIRIDGHIKGSLRCEAKVIIGPGGRIEGEVHCQHAVIEGNFDGKLFVKELLNIRETAKVTGEVRYSKLIVQPGAVLSGDVRLHSSKDSSAKPGSLNPSSLGNKTAEQTGQPKESANR